MNTENCLICEKPKLQSDIKCKLCGMGIERYNFRSHDFLFCCTGCKDKFEVILDNCSGLEKDNIINSEVVI